MDIQQVEFKKRDNLSPAEGGVSALQSKQLRETKRKIPVNSGHFILPATPEGSASKLLDQCSVHCTSDTDTL